MIETLKNIDTQLLLFFNHLNIPLLDFIFYWISEKWIWVPFYVFLAWLVIRKYKQNSIWIFIFVAAAIAASDQIASGLIKENVKRLRPCHEPSIMNEIHIVMGYCGGPYGFISSHATNTFTLAAFLIRLIPDSFRGFVSMMWIWAAVVSFSRIYLGVHYPGDVIVAIILGLLIGKIFANVCFKVMDKKSLIKSNV